VYELCEEADEGGVVVVKELDAAVETCAGPATVSVEGAVTKTGTRLIRRRFGGARTLDGVAVVDRGGGDSNSSRPDAIEGNEGGGEVVRVDRNTAPVAEV